MLLLIFNIVKSCWKVGIANCAVKLAFAPQVPLRIPKAHLRRVAKKFVGRVALKDLKRLLDAHLAWQPNDNVDMVGHDLDFKNFNAMLGSRFPDACFRKIFMVQFAKDFVTVFCAPAKVP